MGQAEGEIDATITQDYDTAVALSKNELSPTAAYMSGKLKVAGDLMKLMQLQGALSQMTVAAQGRRRRLLGRGASAATPETDDQNAPGAGRTMNVALALASVRPPSSRTVASP